MKNYKKKVFSLTLSLLLVTTIMLGLIPSQIPVSAEEDNVHQIKVGFYKDGAKVEQIYKLNSDTPDPSLPTDLSWDYGTKTLTLDNFNGLYIIDYGKFGENKITIHLKGENTLKSGPNRAGDSNVGIGWYSDLTITAESDAKLTIDDTYDKSLRNINVMNYKLEIKGGTLILRAESSYTIDSNDYLSSANIFAGKGISM